ncbi:MAG: NAD-dependent epimerase/dehydratase family protein [Gemmatimonadetes bacterium]|nr:NAD-dependent epimerase/dehydratase family protein [Gemmatimonadota bacterium]
MPHPVEHLVLGAGQVGTAIARILVSRGEEVRLGTRAGSIPVGAGLERAAPVAVDVTDPASLQAAAQGAGVAYLAVQPPYHLWPEGFPRLLSGVLGGLSGADLKLVVVDNLYMYGPTMGQPLKENLPHAAMDAKGKTRAAFARALLEAHARGDLEVTLARASDFFGPGAVDSTVGERFVPAILKGEGVQVMGDPDLARSYTYLPDFAEAIVELAGRGDASGRAWHVPSGSAGSTRALVEALAAAAGTRPRILPVSRRQLRLAGLFMPPAREIADIWYQFDQPFVVDSSDFEARFTTRATPLAEAAAATVAWYQARSRSATP